MSQVNQDAHARMLFARAHKRSRLAVRAPIPTPAQATGKRGGHHATVTKQLRKLSQGL